MAKGRKAKETPLSRRSSIFRAAIRAVQQMKNTEKEPLPGRKPSSVFRAALRVLRDLGKQE